MTPPQLRNRAQSSKAQQQLSQREQQHLLTMSEESETGLTRELIRQMFSNCPGLQTFHGNPPAPDRILPHLAILAEIEAAEGTQALREEPASLEGWREIMEAYWGLVTVPLAQYAFGRSELILCEDGIYEVDEHEDYIRYWGGDEEGLERNEWIFAQHGSGSDSD
ncbi:hypothetical protein BJ508DRAFT_346125 [Ascobolus immersus RN42]|uniref:Uncharacterized protein n=1 Tax=Ascobolus immersus RN42 TaxID=1160509 RepID=A0A3N4I788_ASCIM|nr:hypothetical protein BJ508DRAFT_346125 [Ascobolus immersus RN42]